MVVSKVQNIVQETATDQPMPTTASTPAAAAAADASVAVLVGLNETTVNNNL